jgi:rod shape-determining protein MreC
MDSLLNRYRNVTVLVLAIMAQLVLLAYQVKTGNDVRLIRVWAVTAVTPIANALESARGGIAGFWGNYVALRDTREQNRAMREELGKLKMENQFLRTELATADRARALSVFQQRTPSRTIAARVIAAGAGSGSHVVFVDRGSVAGVMKGMAVVTPDGIAGKVIAAYPTASQVVLITDPSFAAGVVSRTNRVRGILKGQGHAICLVDRVQSELKVEPGEWFYTSGDDRVFPKGMPVGQVRSVKPGAPFQEILLEPSALQGGLEEVLIVLEGVHQQIPESETPGQGMHVLPPPPPDPAESDVPVTAGPGTEADRLRDRYKAIGAAQGHVFGEGGPGARPPDFNAPPAPPAAAPPSTEAPKTPAGAQ